MGVHGVEQMLLLEQETVRGALPVAGALVARLVPLSDRGDWLNHSVRVMEGDFTDKSDRHKLVDGAPE